MLLQTFSTWPTASQRFLYFLDSLFQFGQMLLHFRKHTFNFLAVWPSEETVVIVVIDITL